VNKPPAIEPRFLDNLSAAVPTTVGGAQQRQNILSPWVAARPGTALAFGWTVLGGVDLRGGTMNPFTRFAFFTVARDAGFVALAAMLLMLAFSFEPVLAFGVGATIALVFSMGLLVRVYFLTEERLERSEVWRALPAEERPPGDDGRRWAKGYLETLLLHFAKDASAFASLLYCSALVMALAAGLAQANTVSLPSHQFVNTESAHFTLK
jgi:hypothetical protein